MEKVIKKEIKDQIDEVMEWFDFEKVHLAMIALDWSWASTGGVPTLTQIKNNAKELLWKAYGTESSTIGTGGFYAIYHKKENYFELYFAVSTWDTYN